jgi:hypothetical protein
VSVAREALIRRVVQGMMCDYRVSLAVVLHALAVHNGELVRARRYLAGEKDTAPWTLAEDVLIATGGGQAKEVLEARGVAACQDRAQFLSSSI